MSGDTRLHHVGIATVNGQQTSEFFEKHLGGTLVSTTDYPEMKQVSRMVQLGECQLEIMEGTDPDGVVSKYIEKKGAGLHHISIEVRDLVALAEKLEASGILLLSKSLEDPHVRYLFISPKSTGGILIELCEYL